MRSARFTALAFAVVCLAPLAEGQNLVSNSGFDTDVTGWSPFLMASIAWSSLDATAAPSSGSAFLTNSSTTAIDGTGARQCIDGLGERTEIPHFCRHPCTLTTLEFIEHIFSDGFESRRHHVQPGQRRVVSTMAYINW